VKYQLFFFKENTRNIDIDELFRFFTSYPEFSIISEDDSVEIKYQNKKLAFDASFFFSKVSKVPDIYRLDPKFLDLDIYLSVDTMLPLYKFSIIADIVEALCKRFNFYIYQVLFENVSAFKKDLLIKSYEIIRNAYRNKFPMEYASLVYLSKEKLDVIFKYITEREELIKYYQDKNYLFPEVYFVKNRNNGSVNIVTEYVSGSNFVFPPCLDYIVFKNGLSYKIIDYNNVRDEIFKYSTDIPGFISNTRVLDKNGVKKIVKILSNKKIKAINDDIANVDIESLIDF